MNIQFRLSTFLLVATIIALVVGWISNRIALQRRLDLMEQQHAKRILIVKKEARDASFASTRFCDTLEKIQNFRAYTDGSREQFEEYTQNRLIGAMHQLWRHENEIDPMIRSSGRFSAELLAKDILKLFDFNTAEEYFAFSASRVPNVGSNGFYESHQPGRLQHEPFRRFVERAAGLEEQIVWPEFETWADFQRQAESQ